MQIEIGLATTQDVRSLTREGKLEGYRSILISKFDNYFWQMNSGYIEMLDPRMRQRVHLSIGMSNEVPPGAFGVKQLYKGSEVSPPELEKISKVWKTLVDGENGKLIFFTKDEIKGKDGRPLEIAPQDLENSQDYIDCLGELKKGLDSFLERAMNGNSTQSVNLSEILPPKTPSDTPADVSLEKTNSPLPLEECLKEFLPREYAKRVRNAAKAAKKEAKKAEKERKKAAKIERKRESTFRY